MKFAWLCLPHLLCSCIRQNRTHRFRNFNFFSVNSENNWLIDFDVQKRNNEISKIITFSIGESKSLSVSQTVQHTGTIFSNYSLLINSRDEQRCNYEQNLLILNFKVKACPRNQKLKSEIMRMILIHINMSLLREHLED